MIEYATEEASTLLTSIDEDTMLEMFEDHARITVSRSGVEVEGYEHD